MRRWGKRALSTAASTPAAPAKLPVPSGVSSALLKNLANLDPFGDVQPALQLYNKRCDWYTELGSSTVALDLPSRPYVISSSPELIRAVLGSKRASFMHGAGTRQSLGAVFPASGAAAEGEQLDRINDVIARSLGAGPLCAFIPAVTKCASRALTVMVDSSVYFGHSVDIQPITARILFDAYHRYAFEWDPRTIAATEDHMEDPEGLPLLKAHLRIAEHLHERAASVFEWRGLLPSPPSVLLPLAKRTMLNKMDSLLEARLGDMARRGGQPRAAFDGLLLEATGEGGLSPTELRQTLAALMVETVESTNNAVAFAFHLLGQHPEVQEKLREEVKGVNLYRATTPGLDALPLLQSVLREARRLHPASWCVGRECVEDVEAGGVALEKGTQLLLDHAALGRQPELWEGQDDLDQFRPERFAGLSSDPLDRGSTSTSSTITSTSERMQELGVATIIASFLQRYKWTAARAGPMELRAGLGLKPMTGKHGAWIRFEAFEPPDQADLLAELADSPISEKPASFG